MAASKTLKEHHGVYSGERPHPDMSKYDERRHEMDNDGREGAK